LQHRTIVANIRAAAQKIFVNSGDPCVIPSKVEGSRSVTLKLSHRDASAAAQDDGKTR